MEETQEVSFVTRKALVTFTRQIAILLHDEVVLIQNAICEWQEDNAKYSGPRVFKIVGLQGKKLEKSQTLHSDYGLVAGWVELD